MTRIYLILISVLVSILGTACVNRSSDKTATSEIKLVLVVLEAQVVDTVVGDGEPIKNKNLVSIKFQVWAYDPNKPLGQGLLIEQNPENQDFRLQVGDRSILAAWEDSLIGMRPGGRRSILLPPDMAYGKTGIKNLLKGSTPLLIQVELLKVLR